ncbi:hypothetical protein Plhal703r1_c05g0030991 [Plasmopara halstedii]
MTESGTSFSTTGGQFGGSVELANHVECEQWRDLKVRKANACYVPNGRRAVVYQFSDAVLNVPGEFDEFWLKKVGFVWLTQSWKC